MKPYKLMAIAILLFFCTLMHSPQANATSPRSDTSSGDTRSVEEYLSQLAKTYDCYFTLEEAYEDGGTANQLSSYMVKSSPPKLSLNESLEELRRTVPNLTFTINDSTPRIVHITDARLAKKREYAMERVIKNIEFAGDVGSLISMLNMQGVPVSMPSVFTTDELRFRDLFTKGRIKGEGLKVRDILTSFLSLKGYRKLIWISQTSLGGKDNTTYIRFCGPELKSGS
jgi:hypothetical protein